MVRSIRDRAMDAATSSKRGVTPEVITEESRRSLAGASAGHREIKWGASSGSVRQSLQEASWAREDGSLRCRKWLASCSRPSQPTSNHSRKLFWRVSIGSPRVTRQWLTGLPKRTEQSDSGRWSHSSRNARNSFVKVQPLYLLLPSQPAARASHEWVDGGQVALFQKGWESRNDPPQR